MAVGPFTELERSYRDLRWHLDPVAASQAGVTVHDARYGRFNPDALRPYLAALKSLAAALEETAVASLEEEIDRTALLNEARVLLRRLETERPQARDPEFWLSHLLAGLHTLVVRADRTPAERAQALAARLDDVPAFLDDARATLLEPVRVFCETGLGMTAGGLALVREIAAAGAAGAPELAPALQTAAARAGEALAAFEHDLERWLETGSDHFALGEDAFNFRLHYEHALRDTAPELWRYGQHLREEVEADLTARAAHFRAGARWQDVAARLRENHPSADGLVAAYARAMARARDFVAARKIAALPDAPVEVCATPPFLRPVMPFAAYDAPGPYSADRKGWFYVTPPEAGADSPGAERRLRDHCVHELAATALHEGYPGHHLQILAAQALGSEVRRRVTSALTVEGWALYCEEMMAEEGFYASEEERFFQRVHLMWRAVRILLDVGLHTRGMPRDDAVRALADGAAIEPASADAEVRRYCAHPAYQLCYAVGRRELLRLRDDFRRARGPAGSLRDFHDAVLAYGGLPVSFMRWGMGLGE